MAGWSRELSAVGGRNTLLWAPEQRGGYLDLTTAHPGGISMLLAGRRTSLSDLVREAGAFDEALRLTRRLFHAQRTLRDERGLHTGFVAIGVATWDSPRAGAVVEAPVLLRTCTLIPTGPGEPDFDLDLGAGVEVNPSLVNYLGSVAGVAVDGRALAGLTEVAAGFDPYPVYAALGQLCADVPGFAVTPRLVLGSYPHGKPAMVADIGANTQWLAQVDVVAALAGDPAAAARLDTELPGVDADPDPEREVLVLDLDGAQQSVLEAVRAGHQLVLEAPLGTGRTQTLAALIASLAHDDKRILYVTRRRHSILALRARLAEVGLGELVLDLTGTAEDRGPALRELADALRAVGDADEIALQDLAEPRGRIARATATAECQQLLREHVAALHETRSPWGVTAYTVQQQIARLGEHQPPPAARVRLDAATLRRVDKARLAELTAQLHAAADAGAWSDEPGGDPWYAADIATEADVERARDLVTRLVDGQLAEATTQLDDILAESRLPAARSPRDWAAAIGTMQGVRHTLEVFRPEIFDGPLDEHLAATGSPGYRSASTVGLGPVARSRVRRQARRLLRPGRPPADLHAELAAAQQLRRAWHQLVGAGGRPEISPRLDEAGQRYAALAADLGWLGHRLADHPDLTAMTLPVLRTRLARLRERLPRLQVLPQVNPVVGALREAGLGEVVDDFAHRGVPATEVAVELEHIWWASIAHDITSDDPRYARHDGAVLTEATARLAELDQQSRAVDATRVAALVARRARRRAREHPRLVDLVHGQAGLPHGHLPFADIFREAEQVLTALRPCLATSPYAVAQLLGPGLSFDLVIVDDASDLTVAEAVSALSRGAKALVVGDPGGSAPAAFAVSGGPAAAGPGSTPAAAGPPGAPESLLDAARRVLPHRELSWWHAPADARLGLDPGPRRRAGLPGPLQIPAVRLVSVDGSAAQLPASDAAIEATDAEADRVVELVLDLARRAPDRSLAVLTVTAAMAERVRARLRQALGLLPPDAAELSRLTDTEHAEPFLVDSIDRAREVCRDVVVLAVGYGRTPHGRVLHRFPSLATASAEADLLRAAAAGRRELVVVSSLAAADLDPARLRQPAAHRLRELLAHAERRAVPAAGQLEQVDALLAETDALLADLATRLRREGLLVGETLGPPGHHVELAVGHRSRPGHWLVAVELDGPRYAALPGVRGRDVVRPRQAAALGWRHLRVWSTDLYRDPAREVARVVQALREALGGAGEPAAEQVTADLGDPAPAGRDRPAAPPENRAQEPDPQTESTLADVDDSPADTDDGAPAPPAAPADEPGRAEPPRAEPLPTTGGSTARRQPAPTRPEQTRDDTDLGWGQLPDESAHDRWLQEQRPPHWE